MEAGEKPEAPKETARSTGRMERIRRYLRQVGQLDCVVLAM